MQGGRDSQGAKSIEGRSPPNWRRKLQQTIYEHDATRWEEDVWKSQWGKTRKLRKVLIRGNHMINRRCPNILG